MVLYKHFFHGHFIAIAMGHAMKLSCFPLHISVGHLEIHGITMLIPWPVSLVVKTV